MTNFADADHEVREDPEPGERVSVRMNLNTGAVIVKRRNSEHGEYGETLVQTPRCVILDDVEFKVQDKAHEKVVEEGSRDVCAYAVGTFRAITDQYGYVHPSYAKGAEKAAPVAYNPFRSKYFHVPEGQLGELMPVRAAGRLWTWSEPSDDGPKGRMKARNIYLHTS